MQQEHRSGVEAHLEIDVVVGLDAGIEAERRVGPHANLAAAALDLKVLRVLAIARVDGRLVAVGKWLRDSHTQALDAKGMDRARIGRWLRGRRRGVDRAAAAGRPPLLIVARRAGPGLDPTRGVAVEALPAALNSDPVVVGVVPALLGKRRLARPDLEKVGDGSE